MILGNNKQMLIYGFNNDEKAILDSVIEKNNLPSCRVIDKSMGKMKISDILSGLRFDIYGEDLPEEKVILFNNFSDHELDTAIKNIRSNKDLSSILAVITPTSITWEFKDLLEHLIEERNWQRLRST